MGQTKDQRLKTKGIKENEIFSESSVFGLQSSV